MFQITESTEARLASVTNRVEKHGDDDVPAVSLALEITTANTILDLIDPTLRQALYKAVEDQEQLPCVEVSTPVLRCNSIDRAVLATKHEGWTLRVDDGIDDTQPMTFGSAKVDKLSVEPKQGGSVVLRLRIGTSNVDSYKLGQLAMHNGQSIWITLKAPEMRPDAIDGSAAAFEADHPDATDLFAAGEDHEGEVEELQDEDGNEESLAGGEAWPFPRNGVAEAPPQSVTIERSQPGTRTARGREKTKAALADGAAQ